MVSSLQSCNRNQSDSWRAATNQIVSTMLTLYCSCRYTKYTLYLCNQNRKWFYRVKRWELGAGWWDLSTEWRCISRERISLFHCFFVFFHCVGEPNQTDSRWERWNDAARMQPWPQAKIDGIYINWTFKVSMIELLSRGNLLNEAWTKRRRNAIIKYDLS